MKDIKNPVLIVILRDLYLLIGNKRYEAESRSSREICSDDATIVRLVYQI